jgi:hypothetical protein
MRIDYQLLLTDISKKQGLGLIPTEMALIIHTDLLTYAYAYIMYEDEDYLTIVAPDEEGHEFCKILAKKNIQCIEIIYEEMIPEKLDKWRDLIYA